MYFSEKFSNFFGKLHDFLLSDIPLRIMWLGGKNYIFGPVQLTFLIMLELGAERYTCRNMFGFGYSQNSVSESNLFAEIPNPKLMPKSQTYAEIPNICRNPKHMPKFQTYAEIPNICRNSNIWKYMPKSLMLDLEMDGILFIIFIIGLCRSW